MTKQHISQLPPLTYLKDLSRTELQAHFESLLATFNETDVTDTVANLVHELQVHQIELEMQNRDLQEAQQQLEEARDRYADLYDFAPVCYITFDAKGCIREINLTGASMLGQQRGRLLGKPFSQWLSHAGLQKFFKHLEHAQEGNIVLTEELQLQMGKRGVLDIRLETIATSQSIDGKPTFRSVLINVSARKQVERELRNQTRHMRLMTDAMPALIAYIDREERYRFVNKTYETWNRRPCETILGQSIKENVGEKIYQHISPFIQCALTGKTVNFELTIPKRADENSTRDINASYIPDFGSDGRVMGFFALIRDVTDVKQLEAENKMRLLETARVARVNTMGEMVAEIAHELNQPLAAISIYSDSISRMLDKEDIQREDIFTALAEIRLQAGRAGEVIRRLREFVSKKMLQPDETDINAVVQEVLHLVSVEAHWHHVSLKLELDETIPCVQVDKILIEQVILNLARNAIEAMGEIEQAKRHLLIRTVRGKHQEIELNVEDSGPGLGGTEIEQVFEPFYSSKLDGMGMGLAISRSIIKAHHGRLWAIPNDHGGTTFTFTLPASDPAEKVQQVE